MMEENINIEKLIESFGALTEMWMLTYKHFIGQGLSVDEAMAHTREFMKAMITSLK